MIRKLGLRRLRHFASLSSKAVTSENPKIVHDIRVASRRLQQILDFLHPPPRSPAIRHLRNRLRRTRRSLGKVRDYDVFIASIDERLKSKRPAQRPLLVAIHERLAKRRAKSMQKARDAFDKYDVVMLCKRLKNALGQTDQPNESTGPPPLSINIALNRLWQDLATEASYSLKEPRPENIHLVRIKAKRLRYLLEVFGELGNRGADTPINLLQRLQQCLGNWHDLEVQEEILVKENARRPVSRSASTNDDLISLFHEMHIAKKDLEQEYLKLVANDRMWQRLERWMSTHIMT